MVSKSKPKVSVIVPTYNRAHVIDRAIRSVLNQTYQDFELIIVDGASTDNTEEVVKIFNDVRIRYIRQEINKGTQAGRNIGIKAAKGEYIAFQDSDDEWLPEKLEKQMKVFQQLSPKVGMVYTDMIRINRNGKFFIYEAPTIMPDDGFVYQKALNYYIGNIGIQTAVIRRTCFETVGLLDERLPAFDDLELFIRLSKYYYFYHIDEPLVKYYATEGSFGSNKRSWVAARKMILEKYFDDIKKDKKVLANHYFQIAINLCNIKEFEEGLNYFYKIFEIDPNIRENRKLLSEYCYHIGVSLYSNDDLKNGRCYLLKAAYKNPLNIKYVLVAFIALLCKNLYNITMKIYQRIKPPERYWS